MKEGKYTTVTHLLEMARAVQGYFPFSAGENGAGSVGAAVLTAEGNIYWNLY